MGVSCIIASTMLTLLFIFGIFGALVTTEVSEELVETERQAFAMCDSDKMVGLTWQEVEKCEERFADLLEEQGIDVPSEEDFKAADLDGDGTLLFEEWMEWLQIKSPKVGLLLFNLMM